MINQVVLEGRVVKTPEIQHTRDGQPFVVFTLANNRPYKQDEEWKEATHFIDCVIFSEVILEKGDRVIVFGSLQQRNFEKDGKKQSKISIKVKNVRILAKGKKNEELDEEIEF